MSSVSGHSEVEEKLPAAALMILDSAEMEQVRAHIRDCPECAILLEEYRDAMTSLSLQLSRTPMDSVRSDAVRGRLLARAHAKPRNTRKASTMIYHWSGWMVAAGLAGVLLVHHSVHRPLDYGWLAAGFLVVALLGVGIYAWVQRSRVVELERDSGEAGTRVRYKNSSSGV
jgi:anti-sigma factor RsiW